MPYFTLNDLTALIPPDWLTESLDDNADGVEDAFSAVQGLAENEVNGELGRLYTVPFDTSGNEGLRAFLCSLCVLIALEAIYERRGQEMKKTRADTLATLRKRLARIGNGDEKLNPEVEQVDDTAAVISEPSKIFSRLTNA